jgi:hypothetical protein
MSKKQASSKRGLPPPAERKDEKTVTIDCKNDPAGRFVASNERYAGREIESDPTSEVTGSSIWRNPVFYCKSPNYKAKLGVSVRSVIKMRDEELFALLEEFDIDQLYTILKRAKGKVTEAEKSQEIEKVRAYSKLVKVAEVSIKDYQDTLKKGKGKGKEVVPKKSGTTQAVKQSKKESMEEGIV